MAEPANSETTAARAVKGGARTTSARAPGGSPRRTSLARVLASSRILCIFQLATIKGWRSDIGVPPGPLFQGLNPRQLLALQQLDKGPPPGGDVGELLVLPRLVQGHV